MDTEVERRGGAYEVEVKRADGSQVEVQLDRNFAVVSSERDDADDKDEADDEDDAEGRRGGRRLMRWAAPTTVAVLALGGAGAATTALAGQGGEPLPKGSEPVRLDPADFTTKIDNPYWPMRPGSRWVYRETNADGAKRRVVVTVTNKVKRIANGIMARVVHDVVTETAGSSR